MLTSRVITAAALSGAFAGALLATSGSALALEVKEATPDVAPARALSALPTTTPGNMQPGFAVERPFQDMWRGFLHTYRNGDKTAAFRQLEAAVEKGDVLAIWKLGRMYAEGEGVGRDHFKAFQLFSRIADGRTDEGRDSPHAGVIANAIVSIGHYWLDGIPQSPIKANPAQAAKAFNHAAVFFGHPDAQFQLARMLLDGVGGKADPRMGARWMSLAAEKGHVQAQAILGRMLFTGENMPRHAWKGLMWLKIASEGSDAGRDTWVREMHRKAHDQATEDERRTAAQHAQRFIRQAESRAAATVTTAAPPRQQ